LKCLRADWAEETLAAIRVACAPNMKRADLERWLDDLQTVAAGSSLEEQARLNAEFGADLRAALLKRRQEADNG
jgi:endogenous inhibitor of DNA gyrase (YacG/DUF329 family)